MSKNEKINALTKLLIGGASQQPGEVQIEQVVRGGQQVAGVPRKVGRDGALQGGALSHTLWNRRWI